MVLTSTDLDCGPGVKAFSTERGAIGTIDPSDPYSGLNTCRYTGDSAAHVADSLRCVASGVTLQRLILPLQTHSLNVATVTAETPDADLEGVDAVVTADPLAAIGIHTADCVPLVMSDPEARVIAAVHSGWKGTVGRIAARAVDAMTRLGADPGRIRAAMGPCIGPCCFEVGQEVVDRFADAGFDPAAITVGGFAKPHIDLPAAVALTLRECGVMAIAAPPACSRCNPLRFCSARHSGINSARTLTLIRLI